MPCSPISFVVIVALTFVLRLRPIGSYDDARWTIWKIARMRRWLKGEYW